MPKRPSRRRQGLPMAISVGIPPVFAVCTAAILAASDLPAPVAWTVVAVLAVVLALAWSRQLRLVGELTEATLADPLTRLLNRSAFQQLLETEMRQRRRGDRHQALLVMDIDNFKSVNDRLGHLGGDMALERLSGVINAAKRNVDHAGRLGGDEFAILLPGTGALEALAFAERIRSRLSSSFDGTAAQITLSIGIAAAPEHGVIPEDLLHAADEAMYSAKAMGRNRCVIYSEEAVNALSPGRDQGRKAPVPASTR